MEDQYCQLRSALLQEGNTCSSQHGLLQHLNHDHQYCLIPVVHQFEAKNANHAVLCTDVREDQ